VQFEILNRASGLQKCCPELSPCIRLLAEGHGRPGPCLNKLYDNWMQPALTSYNTSLIYFTNKFAKLFFSL
jgi:hypothetical protein